MRTRWMRMVISVLGVIFLCFSVTLIAKEEELEDMIEAIDKNISRKWDDRSSYDSELRDIDRKMDEILPFKEFPLKLEDYEPYDSLLVLTGNVRGDPTQDLRKVTKDIEDTKTDRRRSTRIFRIQKEERDFRKVVSSLICIPIKCKERMISGPDCSDC